MNTEAPQMALNEILDQIEQRANAATPGPWRFEPGGGHAYNRIVGSESVQTNGWPERINGISNASYTDRICENLGNPDLPYPAANVAFIASARTDVPKLVKALRRALRAAPQSRFLNEELAAILAPSEHASMTQEKGVSSATLDAARAFQKEKDSGK